MLFCYVYIRMHHSCSRGWGPQILSKIMWQPLCPPLRFFEGNNVEVHVCIQKANQRNIFTKIMWLPLSAPPQNFLPSTALSITSEVSIPVFLETVEDTTLWIRMKLGYYSFFVSRTGLQRSIIILNRTFWPLPNLKNLILLVFWGLLHMYMCLHIF